VVKPQASAEIPRYGGTVKVITSMAANNLGCPWERRMPTDSQLSIPAIETLIRFDEKGFPTVPVLATSWKLSNDKTAITLALRRGVKFHDGEDFNAEAVKANLEMTRVSANAPSLKIISSVDVIDNYTVKLNLSRFDPTIFNSLASGALPAGMISPAAIKKGKDFCLTHPVGTGPFKMSNFQRDVSLRFEKFDGYWQKGKPYLDAIEWLFIADRVSAQMAFKAGQSQVIYGINPSDAEDLKAAGKYVIAMTPSGGFGLAGDSSNPKSPFADIRVRRALEYAINKEAIAKGMGYNFYWTANQPATAVNWYYNPKVVGYPYNPKKAKELLTQAGYGNGLKTRMIIATTNPKDVYLAIQNNLADVGIDAKLEVVTPANYAEIMLNGWENSLLYYNHPTGVGMDPAMSLASNLSSKGRYVSIQHPADYEAKLDKASTELDPKRRVAMFQELMKIVIDRYALINMVYSGTWIAARTPEVRNLNLCDIWFQQWTPGEGWLSK
jgi:peptide/nickel transport system substrate-binding protein